MQARLGSSITATAVELGIPAILLEAMTAIIGVYKSLEDLLNHHPEDCWITAHLTFVIRFPWRSSAAECRVDPGGLHARLSRLVVEDGNSVNDDLQLSRSIEPDHYFIDR
ncbi:hypothetical protein DIZ76_012403 [Coccidioides immitis]|nr:hypothetical protein DIZ76_012403 [Coccidioides immitis]